MVCNVIVGFILFLNLVLFLSEFHSCKYYVHSLLVLVIEILQCSFIILFKYLLLLNQIYFRPLIKSKNYSYIIYSEIYNLFPYSYTMNLSLLCHYSTLGFIITMHLLVWLELPVELRNAFLKVLPGSTRIPFY